MSHPVIGWEAESPVPDYTFNDYLSARDGRLYYEDLDLAQLFVGGREDQGLGAPSTCGPTPGTPRRPPIH